MAKEYVTLLLKVNKDTSFLTTGLFTIYLLKHSQEEIFSFSSDIVFAQFVHIFIEIECLKSSKVFEGSYKEAL